MNTKMSSAARDMARPIQIYDWENSCLGPASGWPRHLKAAVDIMLGSQSQILIFWGEDLITLYNDAYALTIGRKHPQALGRPARESWGDLWKDLEPLLRRVLHDGQTVAARDHPFYIDPRGHPETVYFDISFSPLRDDDGQVRGVFCIVSETTERVTFERALRESEERFRAIFSQSAAGISQTDLSGPICLVNRRFCEIVGYNEAELLAMRMQDIIFIDDLPNYVRLFKAMAEKGESFDIELRYVRKDGNQVWVAKSISALPDKDGNIRQAAAIVVDITERKRAQEVERHLAAIIASSNEAILGIDLNMKITSWNSGAERLYGYSADDVIGRSVLILVPDERIDEEPAIFRQVNVGLKVEPYETKRRRKDGQLVDVLLSVSPIYDPYGRIVGASKIAHDISARKDAERLQTVLVGELNHRVKNVLATVIAIARQTLARDETDRNGVEAFQARLMSMARAHDLLTQGNWKGAELGAVVEQAVSPYPWEKFESTGPAIHLPPKVALSISLVLHELATNAAKYGALSTAVGRVSINWSLEAYGQSPRLKLRWQEVGGPPVNEPSRKGFGSRLIERVLAAELGGKAKLFYSRSGLICEFDAAIEGGWNHQPPFDEEGVGDLESKL